MPPKRSIPRGYAFIVLRAMRPHFFAFPVGAALAGAQIEGVTPNFRLFLVCAIASLGWGVGQLLNDLFDEEADKIDAPHRPAVQGLLPMKPTLIVCGAIGLLLVVTVAWIHPAGLALAAVAAILIATYNRAKRYPLLGNLSHALVMATATLIGAASLRPELNIYSILQRSTPTMLLCGTWAAIYLQANYEKDRRGDLAGGYRTLAHLLGVRGSAIFRIFASLVFYLLASETIGEAAPSALLLASVVAVTVSALGVAWVNTEEVALRQYRWAVHGGAVGMLSLGGDGLSTPVFLLLVTVSVLLTEFAFTQSNNP